MSLPTLEPGDLLVKPELGELWALTVEGWRRLTIDTGGETTGLAREAVDPIREAHAEQRDRIVAAVERADKIRARINNPLGQAAEEIQILAGAVRRTIEVAERPDLGVDDRLVAFAEGLDAARQLILNLNLTLRA